MEKKSVLRRFIVHKCHFFSFFDGEASYYQKTM